MAALVCYPVRPFFFDRGGASPAWRYQAKKGTRQPSSWASLPVRRDHADRSDPRQKIFPFGGLQSGHRRQRFNAVDHLGIGIEATPDAGGSEALAKLGHCHHPGHLTIDAKAV